MEWSSIAGVLAMARLESAWNRHRRG